MLNLVKQTLLPGFAVAVSLVLFVPLISLVPPNALAQTEATPFMHEKTYTLPSGKRVTVKFRERSCNNGKSDKSGECAEADAGMWGMDGGTPRFITDVFQVSIDGREFAIPGKFYKDLTNTYRMDVFERNARIIIELKGGDAAGAYTARFTLGGLCGFERKICGGVCKEIWERTTWYNSFAYDAVPGCVSGIQ